jgi:methionyl aminopeptidase
MYTADGKYNNPKNIIETFEDTQYKNLYGVGNVPIEKILEVKPNTDKVESEKIGASIHKAIRRHIRPYLKPGLKLSELANLIENKCKELTKNVGTLNGIGFPSSLSVNNCAAHFTPSKLYDVTLDKASIVKIDFGVEVNGWITDSAFTVAFNEDYKELLDAVKDATNTGIKNAGMGVHIKEWGKDIMEVMESYEVNIDNKTYPVQVIKNLGGHNILKNKIHGGIFLPGTYIGYYPEHLKFEEGIYAVETFGSTGSDSVIEKYEENTIYMNKSLTSNKLDKNENMKLFYDNLLKKYNTMPYCDRYLDNQYNSIYKSKMKTLTDIGYVNKYPPLYCVNNGMTAQYEHTIYINEGKKIIFSSSTDY